MNFVLFLLIGAGIGGLAFGLALFFYSVTKERFAEGVITIFFLASVILTLATSIYVGNTYGYPSGLFVLFGYALNTVLLLLSKIFNKDAE